MRSARVFISCDQRNDYEKNIGKAVGQRFAKRGFETLIPFTHAWRIAVTWLLIKATQRDDHRLPRSIWLTSHVLSLSASQLSFHDTHTRKGIYR
jgi:hypothetical protein